MPEMQQEYTRQSPGKIEPHICHGRRAARGKELNGLVHAGTEQTAQRSGQKGSPSPRPEKSRQQEAQTGKFREMGNFSDQLG